MSKLIKSHRLILDDQIYQLAPQILPVDLQDDPAELEPEEHHEHVIHEPKIDVEAMVRQRMDEVEAEVRLRLQEAEEDREAILQAAYQQAEELKAEAVQQGYEAGQKEGFEEGRNIAEALIQEALEIKAQLNRRKGEVVQAVEQDAVQLIIDTVERILGKHIQEDYDLILGIVRLAMAKVTYTESLSLRVAADDYDMALSMKDQILALAENVDDIQIKSDKSLKQGSCILDAASGSIDSGIWTQFEQIKQGFEEMLASE